MFVSSTLNVIWPVDRWLRLSLAHFLLVRYLFEHLPLSEACVTVSFWLTRVRGKDLNISHWSDSRVAFSHWLSRLCEKDPYQLYQRLEQQAREYVLEMKVRLLKHLSAGSKGASAVQGPPQAHQFISLLLEEYSALCQAARTISTFLLTLVRPTAGQGSFRNQALKVIA